MPPILDGKVEPEEYHDAVRLEGLVDEQTGVATTEGGAFYLGYDERFIYFAAKLVDLKPGSIQATEFRTNVGLEGNDTVTLAIDPFDTLSDFNFFTMNARGATNLQIAGGRAAKREWLGDFAAKGRITPEGWEVEARIPWTVMRLPGKGAHDLRFNVHRNHRRLQRQFAWARISNGLVQNFGRWKAVDLPASQASALQALPYLYGGLDERTGLVANAGVDLRYGLTRDLDLVGTINPDLRNIERAILSLDFSYFERLASENRPFFLEGGQYINGGDSTIFASQRISTFDAGIKTFGKLNPKNDVGFLAAADFGNTDALVARVRRQVGQRTSWSAMYAGGRANGLHGDAVSGSYDQGSGLWSFNGQLYATQNEGRAPGHRLLLGSFYEQNRTFLSLRYNETAPDFDPLLGFSPQRDLRRVNAYGGHGWAAPKRGFVQYGVEGGVGYGKSYNLEKPFVESGEFYPYATLKDGTHFFGILTYSRFFGGTHDQTYGFFLERPQGDPYRNWQVGLSSGTRAGSPYRDLSVGFAYRPLPSLQLNGNLQETTFLGRTQDQTILSANYDLDQYHSVGGRTVVSPQGTNWYVSFRKSGNRGAEYYLILGDPNATHFRTSLVLKAVFPVTFRV